MKKQQKYDDLMVLALSLGFHGYVDENKKMWLSTKFKGQPVPIELDPEQDDIFCGKAELVLKIVDARLGIKTNDTNLELRFNEMYNAFSDKNHKFWDIVRRAN